MAETATPLRAGVYGRESKDKTKSVDDQVAAGVDVIAAEGWVHAGSYDDGSSASRFATKAREDWQRLLDDIKAGALDVLVLWESSRGSREPVDWFTWLGHCRTAGVLIHVISHDRTYDVRRARDWKVLADDGVDAAYETERSSERVRRGVRAAAANGTPHGAVPYGFERRYDPQTKAFVEQRAQLEQAPIVDEVFRRVARADPIVHVVRDLNSRGVPAPGGGQWNRQAIRQMIRNVAYVGQRRHGDTTYAAVWKGLVDEATFRAANRVLDDPDRRRAKPGLKRWLLSYLAVSSCDGQMHAKRARNGQKHIYQCLANGCTGIGQAELDEYVTRLVVARLSRDDARDLFLPDDSEQAIAAEAVKVLEDRLNEWRQSGARGETTPASLAAIERDLTPQIEAADRRRITATVPAALVDLVTTDDVRAVWDGLPLAGRREVLSTLFEQIKVGPPTRRITRWSTDADRLESAAERVSIEWKHP